jgi:hypothetical protein
MFDEFSIILLRIIDIFADTDSFGLSLSEEIIEPMISECEALADLAEETQDLLEELDDALEEIRSMEG